MKGFLMNEKMSSDIPKIVTCPRCLEFFDWEYSSVPSRGWVCWFCREELEMPSPFSHVGSRPMNEMEERKLDEDWDGEVENIPRVKRAV
jgi:hypothetical protein